MNEYTKEQLEEILKDEQQRYDISEDEYLKSLLTVRIKMYQNLINQLETKELM